VWTGRLRDGAPIEIHPIRPDDRQALADGIRRMSPDSRYRRSFEALVAVDRDSELRETLRAAVRGVLRMRLPH
jgi:hypothetical protein